MDGEAVITDESQVPISLTAADWRLILKREPILQESYTPAGEATFAAWQRLHQAIDFRMLP